MKTKNPLFLDRGYARIAHPRRATAPTGAEAALQLSYLNVNDGRMEAYTKESCCAS